jgi:hypothetical protein
MLPRTTVVTIQRSPTISSTRSATSPPMGIADIDRGTWFLIGTKEEEPEPPESHLGAPLPAKNRVWEGRSRRRVLCKRVRRGCPQTKVCRPGSEARQRSRSRDGSTTGPRTRPGSGCLMSGSAPRRRAGRRGPRSSIARSAIDHEPSGRRNPPPPGPRFGLGSGLSPPPPSPSSGASLSSLRMRRNQTSHATRSPTSNTRKPTMKIHPLVDTPRSYPCKPGPARGVGQDGATS